MPRRGGRERYRTLAQVKRAIDYTPPRATLTLAADLAAVIRQGGKVVQNLRIIDCVHGVPWTTCTQCSKPVQQ